MPHKDPVQKAEYHKAYERDRAEKKRQYAKWWYANNKERAQATRLKYRQTEHYREMRKRVKDTYYAKLRREAIHRLGSRCLCCGYADIRFLTIDHINNDGKADRAANGHNNALCVRKGNYDPSVYQVLCFNCNMAKAHYGECPHNEMRICHG